MKDKNERKGEGMVNAIHTPYQTLEEQINAIGSVWDVKNNRLGLRKGTSISDVLKLAAVYAGDELIPDVMDLLRRRCQKYAGYLISAVFLAAVYRSETTLKKMLEPWEQQVRDQILIDLFSTKAIFYPLRPPHTLDLQSGHNHTIQADVQSREQIITNMDYLFETLMQDNSRADSKSRCDSQAAYMEWYCWATGRIEVVQWLQDHFDSPRYRKALLGWMLHRRYFLFDAYGKWLRQGETDRIHQVIPLFVNRIKEIQPDRTQKLVSISDQILAVIEDGQLALDLYHWFELNPYHEDSRFHTFYYGAEPLKSYISLAQSIVKYENAGLLASFLQTGVIKNITQRTRLQEAIQETRNPELLSIFLNWQNENYDPVQEEEKRLKREMAELTMKPGSAKMLRKTFSFKPVDDKQAQDGIKREAVVNYKGNAKVVDIPPRVGKSLVTELGRSAFGLEQWWNTQYHYRNPSLALVSKKDITAVRIPEGITRIHSECFQYLPHLELVVLPKSLKHIGEDAFSYCDMLKQLIIPGEQVEIDRFFLLVDPNGWHGVPENDSLKIIALENSETARNLRQCLKTLDEFYRSPSRSTKPVLKLELVSAEEMAVLIQKQNKEFEERLQNQK